MIPDPYSYRADPAVPAFDDSRPLFVFDNVCVLLRRDGQVQLVYKHAISTIMPGAPVQLYEIDKAVDEADA